MPGLGKSGTSRISFLRSSMCESRLTLKCHRLRATASQRVDMEVTIRHLGDVQFEAEARGHRVLCDQPAENHGSDQGMTPPEFLLASLGTCAGFYAAQYLKARALSAEGLEIKVHAEK